MRAPRFANVAIVCAAAAAALIASPALPPASAGEFRAVQCHVGSELRTLTSSSNIAGLAFQAQCEPPLQRLGIYPPPYTAVSQGDWGQWVISAPGIQLDDISWTPRWDSVHGWQPAFLTESPGGQKHSHPLPPAGIGIPPTEMIANNGPYTAWIQRLDCQEVSCAGFDVTWARVTSDQWQATASDHVAPQITAEQSSLHTNGQAKRGEHSMHLSATDVGGGLRRTWIEVNATQAASQTHGCQTGLEDNIALNLSPCPAAAETTFTLNTAAAPFLDGINRIRACVSDYATNDRENITCTEERPVQVDNTCVDAGVDGGAALSAQFRQPKGKRSGKGAKGPIRPTLLKLPVPGPAVVRGRLTDAGGGPVGGAVLCVREQVLGAGRAITRHTVRTGPDGAFRHKLRRGPNRRITIGYRRGQQQIDSGVTYKARAKPKLKLSHRTIKNRGRLRLKGRIPGPAKAGRIVVLQARYPQQKRWKTFERARTNRKESHGFRWEDHLAVLPGVDHA